MQFKIVCLLTIIFLTGCSLVFKETESEINERQKIVERAKISRLIILDVYHNRCQSCKEIEPIIEKLKLDYSQNNDIVFLKYDLSNPITIYKSKLVSEKLGLENIYNQQRYSGIVLFIDTKSKKVVDNLIAEYNIEKYIKIINENSDET